MKFQNLTDFRHDAPDRLGVLLINLGTPDAPTTQAVRRYLAEFLWDPRVVEVPRPLWWLILHGVILRIRPPRSARAYQEVTAPTDSSATLIATTPASRTAMASTVCRAPRASGGLSQIIASSMGTARYTGLSVPPVTICLPTSTSHMAAMSARISASGPAARRGASWCHHRTMPLNRPSR